ncbi:MAG: monovalent cation:proton antiporter-2 (CPA2) family protein [Nevskiales bacterium]
MPAELPIYILIFLASAVIAVPLFQRLGLGSVLGYLVAGAVIGPQALGLVADVETVRHISELGIVLLLFIIGLELVPARLWQMRRAVFGAGGAQVLGTGALLAAAAWTLGLAPTAALIAGLGLAMSSTAIALQVMAERNEMPTRQGRLGFAVLLMQDLTVIPLLAILPLLGVAAVAQSGTSGWLQALQVLAALAVVLVGGRYLLRPLFRFVAASKSRELFTASALLLVLGVAVLMNFVGLSMALGAFLAGVLLADSEFRHELESDIEPFKGLLLGLFFISVGMSLDISLLREQWLPVLAIVLGMVALKLIVLYALGRAAKLSPREARSFSVTLSQGGEFAFVLFSLALSLQVLEAPTVALLSLAVGLSMATTPLLLLIKDRVLEPWLESSTPREFDALPEDTGPVIIAGFGRFGQIVGRVLALQKIPFTALDQDPSHIQFVSRFGNRVYYGDASRLDLLNTAQVGKARLFVLAIDEVETSVRVAQVLREQYPELGILARARNREHAYRLLNLGVHKVLRETFGSSIEMAEHALLRLGLTDAAAADTVRVFRDQDERLVREAAQHFGDYDKLIELAHKGRAELESLFAQDKQ